MRNMSRQSPRSGALRRVRAAASAGVVLVALHVVGCMERSTEPEAGNSTPFSSEVPALTEIQAVASLSNEQLAALTPAYATWVQAETAWVRAAQPASDPPVLDFLAASAVVLEPAQFSRLVAALHSVQAARSTGAGVADPLFGQPGDRPLQGGRGRGPGHGGPGHRGPRPDPFAELGLSAAQLEQVRAARADLKSAVEALLEQFRAGTLTETELEAGIEAARADFETAIQGILTAEQWAQLQELRRQHLIARLTTRLQRFDQDVARHVARLDVVLMLSDDQVASITTLLANTRPAIEAVLASLQGGSLAPQQALDSLRELEANTTAAIRATLTAEQAVIFDALAHVRRLFPGCRP